MPDGVGAPRGVFGTGTMAASCSTLGAASAAAAACGAEDGVAEKKQKKVAPKQRARQKKAAADNEDLPATPVKGAAAKTKSASGKKAAKTTVEPVEPAAAVETPDKDVTMTAKRVHSRAYHGALRRAKANGFDDVSAKAHARDVAREAKEKFELSISVP